MRTESRNLIGALCLGLCACGEPIPVGPPMPIREVQLSLVVDESLREVLLENVDFPVVAATVAPTTRAQNDGGPLPALVLSPPAKVQFSLGAMGPEYILRLATGFDASAYGGQQSGRVRFRLRAGGQVLFEHIAPFGKQVKLQDREWQRKTIPLAGVESFTLETEVVEGKGQPMAAFGSMEIIAKEERPRELATVSAPNVVMIVVDTLRFDRLGCYGNERGLTPNIDAIAKRGVVFESAFSAAPWTWPSTASIFTGLTPAEHGITSYQACYLAQEFSTFGEVMQRAGWTTGGFSANPLICSEKAFAQGFEHFQSYAWKHGDVLMNDALEWLRGMGDWRFLLYLQFVDPHDYRPSKLSSDKLVGPMPSGFSRPKARGLMSKKALGEQHDRDKLVAYTNYLGDLYDASVADVDLELGRLVEDLRARGQLDNTLFILTADHGEEFLEHGLLYHGNQLYRELVGVPLIIAGPGIPQGQRVSQRVENRFIAGTLLKHLGLETPGGLAGVNLLDSSESLAASKEPSFISTTLGLWPSPEGTYWMGLTMYGVLLGDELFMWVPETPGGSSAMALFDLSQDPDAHVDISKQSAERCEKLQQLIERWLERGAKVRPNVMSGGDSALKALQDIGYIGK